MRMSVRSQSAKDHSEEINVTPLMDVVFILLVFFVVTTSFIKESGIEAARPGSSGPEPGESTFVALYIDEGYKFSINGRTIEPQALGANLQRQRAVFPDAALIIVSARKAKSGSLVLALDEGNLAGFEKISVTATQPE